VSELGSAPPTFAQYIADMAAARMQRLIENAEKLDPEHPEAWEGAVHQMRVWARRTRAALDIIESQFSAPELTELSEVLKQCSAELGIVRDLDVMCESLKIASDSLPANQRAAIDAIISRMQAAREVHLPGLFEASNRLKAQHVQDLLAKWRERSVPVTSTQPEEK
jgi:CHAD domain-containing protein